VVVEMMRVTLSARAFTQRKLSEGILVSRTSTSSSSRQLTSQHTGVEQNVDIRTRSCTYAPNPRPPIFQTQAQAFAGRRDAMPRLPQHYKYSMGRLADSPLRSSTARATCSVASPAPSPSSSSTARRSSLCDARPLTSLASSSARSVRTHPSTTSERRKGQPTMAQLDAMQLDCGMVDDRHCGCSLAKRSRDILNKRQELTGNTVKYSAFLRKQTRYNPTRGGTYSHLYIAHQPIIGYCVMHLCMC
jgi:hypothetical protein